MKPLAACVMMSYDGRSDHGPVWPKPERLATIEPRVLATQVRRGEPPARQRAAGEVLDQHVEVRQQAAQEGAALVLPEVERDALLAAIERQEEDRHAVDRRVAVAPLVAALGCLDLHDLRPEVGRGSSCRRARRGSASGRGRGCPRARSSRAGSGASRRAARPGRRSRPALSHRSACVASMRPTSWSPSGSSSSCSSCFSSGCVSSLVSTGISSDSAISRRLRSMRPARISAVAALLHWPCPSAAASSRGCAPWRPPLPPPGSCSPPGTCATAWCARGRRRA